MDVSTPADLIDKVPSGTQALLYYFRYLSSAINPTRGGLQVLIGDNDRVVGWTYSRSLIGHENEAYFLGISDTTR